MSDAKRIQLRERVDAGLARQEARERSQLAEMRDRVASAAGEHPLLLIAGGLVVGLAISTLVPRSPTRKLSKYAFSGVAMLADLGLAYGKQALESAEGAVQGAGRTGKAKIGGLKDLLAQLPGRTRQEEEPVDTQEDEPVDTGA